MPVFVVVFDDDDEDVDFSVCRFAISYGRRQTDPIASSSDGVRLGLSFESS